MDKSLEQYLSVIERNLKLLPTSERVDIINEIKSGMIEMEQKEGITADEIIRRLGDPKELAREYLGDLICNSNKVEWKKLLVIIAFYSTTGFASLFIIPCASVLSIGMMFCGIISPIAGIIKTGGYLLGFDVPYVMFNFGPFELHPLLVLPGSILVGAGLFFGGRALWRVMIKYIQGISIKKKKLI